MASNFVAYLTANDDSSYIKDILNFYNMARFHPGVEHINLFIAISAVKPITASDMKKLKGLILIVENCKWITVVKVILKGNVGRDFSSAYICLKEIAQLATYNDLVMVKNRSGYGPLTHNWFQSYLKQLSSNSKIGLVGSTINLNGHPKAKLEFNNTHVQTYVYMSYWQHFASIIDIFPAVQCTDRLKLIIEGEIGLSRIFMERNLALSCLAWPDHIFTLQNIKDPHLPQTDIKSKVRGIPIRYKYKSYGRGLLFIRIKYLFLMFSAIRKSPDVTFELSDSFGNLCIKNDCLDYF
ncbi:MAG: hypothetical protein PHH28_05770 [Desulfuromonadaceae bacterium]|nr:hypothetical protein [Desulfuromonadaceae bacterium]